MKMITHVLVGPVVALVWMAASPEKAVAQRSESLYEHQNSRLDVDFPGGTLGSYVEVIRRARPKVAANIVVMLGAKALTVPPVKLIAVNVEAAIRILEGRYVAQGGRGTAVHVETYPIGDSDDLVLKVEAEVERVHVESAVWSLRQAMLDGQSPEDLLGAVEAVLSLFSQKAEVTFHPPTGLLIVRGAGEQLSMVREAIGELIRGAEDVRSRIQRLQERIEELEEAGLDADAMATIGQQQIAVAEARVADTTDAMKKDQARSSDVAEAQLDVMRAQTEFEMHRERHQRLASKLKRLRADLKRLEQPKQ